jgi:hypothetical protein
MHTQSDGSKCNSKHNFITKSLTTYTYSNFLGDIGPCLTTVAVLHIKDYTWTDDIRKIETLRSNDTRYSVSTNVGVQPEHHMLPKAPQHYVQLFTLVSLRYLMTLSISGQYTVHDKMINENGAYYVIKTGRRNRNTRAKLALVTLCPQ